jgi:DNA-binding HxlR family transcriptional regulator
MDSRVSSVRTKLEIYRAASPDAGLADCPIRNVMQTLSTRWAPLLVEVLAEKPHRFGELRRLVPDISQRMLTQTLSDLQRDGYVRREVFPTKPPMVEYSLTELGASMFGALQRLLRWAETNHAAVREARGRFDGVQP